MNAIAEVLGVAAVFAASGAVTFVVTSVAWHKERARRKSEASARWRRNAKRTCAEGDRLIRFRMAEDYRAECERSKRVANWSEHSSDFNSTTRLARPNTVVKGCLAEEFYALDEAARKAVLTR